MFLCPPGTARLRDRLGMHTQVHPCTPTCTPTNAPEGHVTSEDVPGAFSIFSSLLFFSLLLRIVLFSTGPCWEGGQKEWGRETAKVRISAN